MMNLLMLANDPQAAPILMLKQFLLRGTAQEIPSDYASTFLVEPVKD